MRRKEVFISGVICTFLFLQAIAAVGFYSPGLWPFLDYPMYQKPHYEGDAIKNFAVSGVLEDGRVVDVTSHDLGLGFWHFMEGPVEALLHGDLENIRLYARLFQDRQGPELAAVRLENRPFLLSREGVERAPVEVIKTVRFKGAGS